jgi:hypothetical protein
VPGKAQSLSYAGFSKALAIVNCSKYTIGEGFFYVKNFSPTGDQKTNSQVYQSQFLENLDDPG